MKGISEFFALFLQFFCEPEIVFKLRINKYRKDFGFLFGDARNEGAEEGAGARLGEHEGGRDPAEKKRDRAQH